MSAPDTNRPDAREKLRIALECRETMRAHRCGKPIAFQPQRWPRMTARVAA